MKNNHSLLFVAIILVFIALSGCAEKKNNELSSVEKNEGWMLLFDGKTLQNWHVYNKGNRASEWSVMNGEIVCNPDTPDRIGDLTSDKEYENYELHFDWKLSEKGNSGVFINVIEADSLAAGWLTGPEYQLLDNNHKDYSIPVKRAGCLYNFTAQKNEVRMLGAGQWNNSKIIQKNGTATFYLNGVETAEMNFLSDEWHRLVSESGFSKYKSFGKSTRGRIVLQDWGSEVSFRNIKIKEL